MSDYEAPLSSVPSSQAGFGPWPLGLTALRELVTYFIGLVGIGVALGLPLVGPLQSTAMVQIDTRLTMWVSQLRTPGLDELSLYATHLSATLPVIVVLVVTTSLFAWRWRRWRQTLFLPLALGLEASTFLVVSNIVDRTRPPVEQLGAIPPTPSFPSGHAGASVALYGGLAMMVFWHTRRVELRTLAILMAVAIPTIVSLTRIYRGMHYPTDIIGGLLLGTGALLLARRVLEIGATRQADG